MVCPNASSLSWKQITSTLSLNDLCGGLKNTFWVIHWCSQLQIPFHCIVSFFSHWVQFIFFWSIMHVSRKAERPSRSWTFFSRRTPLSVYVEHGKNVLVLNKLLLFSSFARNRLTTVIANRIAVAASFIVLSSEEVVCGSKVITIEGSEHSLTFSSSFVKFAICSEIVLICIIIYSRSFWKYRTSTIRRVDSQVLRPWGLPLFFWYDAIL